MYFLLTGFVQFSEIFAVTTFPLTGIDQNEVGVYFLLSFIIFTKLGLLFVNVQLIHESIKNNMF